MSRVSSQTQAGLQSTCRWGQGDIGPTVAHQQQGHPARLALYWCGVPCPEEETPFLHTELLSPCQDLSLGAEPAKRRALLEFVQRCQVSSGGPACLGHFPGQATVAAQPGRRRCPAPHPHPQRACLGVRATPEQWDTFLYFLLDKSLSS